MYFYNHTISEATQSHNPSQMGEQKVSGLKDEQQMQQFVQHLLADVQALEHMLQEDWFEQDTIRIGAEQEMVIIDQATYKPASIAMKVIEKMAEPTWLDTELARFNLEINLQPQEFKGNCFQKMERENRQLLSKIRTTLQDFNADILLTLSLIHISEPKRPY